MPFAAFANGTSSLYMDSHQERPAPFRFHEASLRRLARRLVDDENDVDDLIQQTWLRWIQGRPSEDRPLLPWLATVLRREFFHERRATRRRADWERAVEPREPTPSPEEDAAYSDTCCALAEAVARLREPYRSAVAGRYQRGLSLPALSAELEVPLETVRTRLKRGLTQLREELRIGRRGTGRSLPGWLPGLLGLLGLGRLTPSKATRRAVFVAAPAGGLACLLGLLAIDRGGAPREAAEVAAARDLGVGTTERGPALVAAGAPDAARIEAATAESATPFHAPEEPLVAARGSVFGRTIEHGTPLAGVRVRAVRSTFPYVLERNTPVVLAETVSASDGTYRLEGVPSDAALMATVSDPPRFALIGKPKAGLPDALSWRRSTPRGPNDWLSSDDPTDLHLVSDYALAVQVVDEQGAPVRGAQLFLKGTDYTLRSAVSDAHGEATFRHLAPGTRLHLGVDAAGFGHEVHGPLRVDGDLGPYRVAVEPELVLGGVIVDRAGLPRAGAPVRLERVVPHGPAGVPGAALRLPIEWRARATPGPLKTDGEGRFRFAGLTAGSYEVAFGLGARGIRSRRTVQAGDLDLRLTPRDSRLRTLVTCTVTAADTGALLPDTRVLAQPFSGGGAIPNPERIADGTIGFAERFRPGRWLFVADAPGYAQQQVEVELGQGERELELTLQPAFHARLVLRDADDRPLEGAWVEIAAGDPAAAERIAGSWWPVGAGGEVALEEVPAEGARIAVHVPHFDAPFPLPLRTVASGEVAVRLPLLHGEGARRPTRLRISGCEPTGSALRVEAYDGRGRLALSWSSAQPDGDPERALTGLRLADGRIEPTAPSMRLLWGVDDSLHPAGPGLWETPELSLPIGELRLRVTCGDASFGFDTTVTADGPWSLEVDRAGKVRTPADASR
ncbi:MAG: sigma-70 family RNA polymerase sigma factor [Planctomycetota bacterium]